MIVGDHPSNMQLQVAPLVKFSPKRRTKNGWNTDSPNRTIKGCKSNKAFQTSQNVFETILLHVFHCNLVGDCLNLQNKLTKKWQLEMQHRFALQASTSALAISKVSMMEVSPRRAASTMAIWPLASGRFMSAPAPREGSRNTKQYICLSG